MYVKELFLVLLITGLATADRLSDYEKVRNEVFKPNFRYDSSGPEIPDEIHRQIKYLANMELEIFGKIEDETNQLLQARNFTSDKCNVDSLKAIVKSTGPQDDGSRFAILPYLEQCFVDQFAFCKSKFNVALHEAVKNLTETNLRDLELGYEVFGKSRTDDLKVLAKGFDWEANEIAERIADFVQKRDPKLFEESKKDPETIMQKHLELVENTFDSIYKATQSGTLPYIYAGYLRNGVDHFDQFELDWMSKLKTTNDVGGYIEHADEIETFLLLNSLIGDYEERGLIPEELSEDSDEEEE